MVLKNLPEVLEEVPWDLSSSRFDWSLKKFRVRWGGGTWVLDEVAGFLEDLIWVHQEGPEALENVKMDLEGLPRSLNSDHLWLHRGRRTSLVLMSMR